MPRRPHSVHVTLAVADDLAPFLDTTLLAVSPYAEIFRPRKVPAVDATSDVRRHGTGKIARLR